MKVIIEPSNTLTGDSLGDTYSWVVERKKYFLDYGLDGKFYLIPEDRREDWEKFYSDNEVNFSDGGSWVQDPVPNYVQEVDYDTFSFYIE